MVLDLITRAAALIAVLGSAVVYGTDVFCAIVLRPALASVDDDALVAVTGRVHRYGDRRMPVPWVLGFSPPRQARCWRVSPHIGLRRSRRAPRWSCCWSGLCSTHG